MGGTVELARGRCETNVGAALVRPWGDRWLLTDDNIKSAIIGFLRGVVHSSTGENLVDF
jgi:hypothetical protein